MITKHYPHTAEEVLNSLRSLSKGYNVLQFAHDMAVLGRESTGRNRDLCLTASNILFDTAHIIGLLKEADDMEDIETESRSLESWEKDWEDQ